MISYFRQIYALVRPYRTRLFLGVLCGVLSGLANPLLAASVKIVTDVVFTADGASRISATLQKAPPFLQKLLAAITAHLPSANTPISTTAKVLIVSLIPLAMLLRGLFTYLNIYFMSWASIRAVTDLRIKLFKHLLSLSLSFFHRVS